jgi:hypothetical protein
MKTHPLLGRAIIAVSALLLSPTFAADPTTGSLVLDLKSLKSDVKIKKNIEKQLANAGLRWTIVDNTVVIPMIDEKFVRPELANVTRYGETDAIDLKPGKYSITCIGYAHSSNSRDVDKVLSASAFFNEGAVTFIVEPGKTTTLEIEPVLQKQKKSSFLIKTKVYVPDLRTKVVVDGEESEVVIINQRIDSSIAWDDYSGSLKF